MPKVNPNDFLLNTDYEMDKIVFLQEGKITSPQTVTIPHKLSFIPLVFGLCSYNQDFSASRPIPYGESPKFYGSVQMPIVEDDISLNMWSYSNHIEVTYRNVTQNPNPIYYRIYAFEPTDANAKSQKTSKESKSFIINTDRNYRKLYKKGIVNMGEEINIKHNFGYIPQIMVWYEIAFNDGTAVTNAYSLSSNDDPTITVTTSNIKFKVPQFAFNVRVHYRIYYDEA